MLYTQEIMITVPRIASGKRLLDSSHWFPIGSQHSTLNVIQRKHLTSNDITDLIEKLRAKGPVIIITRWIYIQYIHVYARTRT